jgi:hypothetical protein
VMDYVIFSHVSRSFLYVSGLWQFHLILSFAMRFVVYCSSSRNSFNLFCISGRLVTPYTNIGEGFAAFRSAVPVFASSFLEFVKTWYLLSSVMSCFVEYLLVLCFLFLSFHTFYSLPWDFLGHVCTVLFIFTCGCRP